MTGNAEALIQEIGERNMENTLSITACSEKQKGIVTAENVPTILAVLLEMRRLARLNSTASASTCDSIDRLIAFLRAFLPRTLHFHRADSSVMKTELGFGDPGKQIDILDAFTAAVIGTLVRRSNTEMSNAIDAYFGEEPGSDAAVVGLCIVKAQRSAPPRDIPRLCRYAARIMREEN